MESQMRHPHDHNYDAHLPSGGLPKVIQGQDEHHHEEKSVLKKVKAKARKIKETLKKHGDGHDHDHSHDEEEDEDEEMEEDPEVHGAPIYESAAIRSAVAEQQPGVNLEKPTLAAEDRYDSKFTDPPTRPFAQEEIGNFLHGREKDMGQPTFNLGTSTALEEDPQAPKDRPELSDYQSKVTDPTGAGGEEAGITPILQSFNKMSVYDEPKPEGAPNLYTGSHDQFSPEPLPANTTTNPEDPGLALKSFDASKPEDMPRDTFTKPPSDQSGYTQKISSATSAITEKAIAAKSVVASKLGNTHEIAATVTGKGQEKGVSVKEYLAEKLRPSDEDKALSEAISGALRKRKQDPDKKAEAKPMGKVTESDGTGSGVASNVSARLKGAVTSWFSMGGDRSQTSQASLGTTNGNERFSSSTSEEVAHGPAGVGERRLQESGN